MFSRLFLPVAAISSEFGYLCAGWLVVRARRTVMVGNLKQVGRTAILPNERMGIRS
ncbi:MAG: hypothetical protein OJF52_001343 [Nitrospira sp.]|nr:MAG: hypothetical protein OJF52_001343 [Nitrospira sp.]